MSRTLAVGFLRAIAQTRACMVALLGIGLHIGQRPFAFHCARHAGQSKRPGMFVVFSDFAPQSGVRPFTRICVGAYMTDSIVHFLPRSSVPSQTVVPSGRYTHAWRNEARRSAPRCVVVARTLSPYRAETLIACIASRCESMCRRSMSTGLPRVTLARCVLLRADTRDRRRGTLAIPSRFQRVHRNPVLARERSHVHVGPLCSVAKLAHGRDIHFLHCPSLSVHRTTKGPTFESRSLVSYDGRARLSWRPSFPSPSPSPSPSLPWCWCRSGSSRACRGPAGVAHPCPPCRSRSGCTPARPWLPSR